MADLAPLFASVDEARLRSARSTKWTLHGPDVLPAWVADMDFAPPAAITAALQSWLDTGFLGYPGAAYVERVRAVAANHLYARFGMSDDPSRMAVMTDVVQGLHATMQVWSKPGDAILILTPIYPPFLKVVEEQGRRLLEHRMEIVDGEYRFDIDALRAQVAAERPPMLMLCSPHNPLGRVFTEAELRQLAELAIEFDMTVIADEIHAEIVFPGHRHIAFETLSEEVRARTVTITSASKSCNTAGLRTAVMAFGSPALQARFDSVISSHIMGAASVPGLRAMEVAWTDPSVAEWVTACTSALNDRCRQFVDALAVSAPDLGCLRPQGTYLAWVDCSALGQSFEGDDSVALRLRAEANLAVSEGPTFGAGLASFVRVNLATSPSIVDEIVRRLGAWADTQRA